MFLTIVDDYLREKNVRISSAWAGRRMNHEEKKKTTQPPPLLPVDQEEKKQRGDQVSKIVVGCPFFVRFRLPSMWDRSKGEGGGDRWMAGVGVRGLTDGGVGVWGVG